jgi:hypothetical protein
VRDFPTAVADEDQAAMDEFGTFVHENLHAAAGETSSSLP